MRLALLLLLFVATDATAQTKFIVPYPPGGIVDILARHVAQKLGGIVVENRVGGVGSVAAMDVERAKPDGRTALVGPITPMAIDPLWFSDPPADRTWALEPAAILAGFPHVLAVAPGSGITSTAQALDALRRHVPYATEGAGSFAHVMGLKLAPDGYPVHYRGGVDSAKAVAVGEVPIGILPGMSALQWPGLRVLGQLPGDRAGGRFAEIPTLREQGVGLAAFGWVALFFAKGTSKDILGSWNEKIARVASGEWYDANGLTVIRMGVDETAGFVAGERARYRQIVHR